MTLILGIEDPANNRTIIACDSGAWRGDQVDTLTTSKIWARDGFVAGLSGSWGHSQLARTVPFPSKPESGWKRHDVELALMDYSCRVLQACGSWAEVTRRVDPDRKAMTPDMLVAYGPWVWFVSDGEATHVSSGYQAIGCGDYALGAMAALRVTDESRSAIEEAGLVMRATATVTRAILGPFRWMATDGAEGGFT